METGNLIIEYLTRLATQLPTLIVLVVGVILALVRWRRHPLVSALACAGIAIVFVNSIVMTGMWTWVPQYLFESGRDPDVVNVLLRVMGIVSEVIYTAGLALLLVAVFVRRPGASVAGSAVGSG